MQLRFNGQWVNVHTAEPTAQQLALWTSVVIKETGNYYQTIISRNIKAQSAKRKVEASVSDAAFRILTKIEGSSLLHSTMRLLI